MQIDTRAPWSESPWRQLAGDFVAPAYESDWNRTATDKRIVHYDRVRPFATRGVLTVALMVLFAVIPGTSPVAWVLLLPAILETALELALEARVRLMTAPHPDKSLLSPLVQLWYRNYERWQINATGLIAALAVPCNLAAVVLFTGTDANGPAKVAAFAVAVLYLNSAVAGPLLDSTVYSPLQKTPQLLRRVRPMLWLGFVIILVGVVASSQQWMSAWPTGALPYAYMVCALPYSLGLRIREYERALGAGALVAAKSQSDANRRVAMDVHDLLQAFKGPLESTLELENLDPSARMGLITFMSNIEVIYKNARNRNTDLQSGVIPPLETIVVNICAPASIVPTTDIGIGNLGTADDTFARQLVSTLTLNATQVYDREFLTDFDRTIDVRAYVTGEWIHIIVTDNLEPITDATWCQPGSTLRFIREELRKRGGDLTQITTTPRGKSIHAAWQIQWPPLRNAPHFTTPNEESAP